MKPSAQLSQDKIPHTTSDSRPLSSRYEAGSGKQLSRTTGNSSAIACPATFDFQLGRRANFFPKTNFLSL